MLGVIVSLVLKLVEMVGGEGLVGDKVAHGLCMGMDGEWLEDPDVALNMSYYNHQSNKGLNRDSLNLALPLTSRWSYVQDNGIVE